MSGFLVFLGAIVLWCTSHAYPLGFCFHTKRSFVVCFAEGRRVGFYSYRFLPSTEVRSVRVMPWKGTLDYYYQTQTPPAPPSGEIVSSPFDMRLAFPGSTLVDVPGVLVRTSGRMDEVRVLGLSWDYCHVRAVWGDPPNTHQQVSVPDWFVAAVGLGVALCSGRGLVRGARRGRKGQCPVCGYDLRASPGRCPECGGGAGKGAAGGSCPGGVEGGLGAPPRP